MDQLKCACGIQWKVESSPGYFARIYCEECREIIWDALADGSRYPFARGGKVENREILATIRAGGFSNTFLVRRLDTGANALLEVLNVHLLDRAGAAALAEHFRAKSADLTGQAFPCVLSYDGCGISQGYPYLEAKTGDGRFLDALLEREKLADPAATEMLYRMVRGVEEMHAAGMMHRALNPGSVFLEGGDPKAPKIAGNVFFELLGEHYFKLESAGRTTSSLAYMPPEQISNPKIADLRADVYALGATAYHVLTGRPPFFEFMSQGREKLLLAVSNHQCTPLARLRSNLPPDLCAAVEKAMALQPIDRYASAGDFRKELAKFVESPDPEPAPVKVPEKPTSSQRANLVVQEGPEKGQRFELGQQAIVGRGYGQGISLSDKKVSSRHAMIVEHEGRYFLHDLGSSNRSYVNEKALDFSPLRSGDRIRFGNTVLEFSGAEQAERTVNPEAPEVKMLGEKESLSEKIVGRCSSVIDTILQGGKVFDEVSLQKLQDKFRFMCQVSTMVGIGLSLDKLLRETIEALGKIFPKVERGVIFLTDSATSQLQPALSFNFKSKKEEAIRVSSTILTQAMEQGMAVLTSDAMADERYGVVQSIMFQRIKLAMCSPLVVRDEVLGAIYLDSTREMSSFNQDDLTLLAAVSSQIAIFIKNARLHHSVVQSEKMEQELSIAQEIQKSFLPSHFPEVEGLEIAACTRPARYVGGDFYDVLQLSDRRIGLVVGDVSGKGAGAALYGASLLSEFRFLARSNPNMEEVFALLNRELCARGTRGMFVTMAYLILDVQKKEIHYINAGHHEPIVLSGGSFGGYYPQAGGPPLGILADMAYSSLRFPFERGTGIVMYTDGVIEAMNTKREEYGKPRLERALTRPPNNQAENRGEKSRMGETRDAGDSSEPASESDSFRSSDFSGHPRELLDYISRQIEGFCGSAEQHDDFTMVIAKFD